MFKKKISVKKLISSIRSEKKKSYQQERNSQINTIRNNGQGLSKLIEHKILPENYWEDYYLKWGVSLNIDRFPGSGVLQKLMNARKIMGKIVHCYNIVPESYDNRPDDEIKVTCKFENYPSIRLYYFKKLNPNDKCKIVTEVKTIKERNLVCELQS